MKTEVYVEFDQRQTNIKRLIDEIKEVWKADERLVKDIEKLEIYFKPQENMCYYVINEDISGKLAIHRK